MKANELMVGDWVNFYPSPLAQNGIYYDRVIVLDRYDVECEPIPLTVEILEKNGLDKVPELSLVLNSTTTPMLCSPMLHYVHELQHALRLCGMSELADNIKV